MSDTNTGNAETKAVPVAATPMPLHGKDSVKDPADTASNEAASTLDDIPRAEKWILWIG